MKRDLTRTEIHILWDMAIMALKNGHVVHEHSDGEFEDEASGLRFHYLNGGPRLGWKMSGIGWSAHIEAKESGRVRCAGDDRKFTDDVMLGAMLVS